MSPGAVQRLTPGFLQVKAVAVLARFCVLGTAYRALGLARPLVSLQVANFVRRWSCEMAIQHLTFQTDPQQANLNTSACRTDV